MKTATRDHHDADVAVSQHRRRPGMGRHPRDLVGVFPVTQPLDLDLEFQRRKPRRVDRAAERDADTRADAGLMRPPRSRRIDDRHDRPAAIARRDQAGQDRVAVAGGAAAGRIGGVGEGHRAGLPGGIGDGVGQRHQLGQHLLVVGPERFRQFHGEPPGLLRIVVGDDQGLASQARAHR